MTNERVVIYAQDSFLGNFAKLAKGIIRYSDQEIVGVIDRSLKGRWVSDMMPTIDKNDRKIPFLESIEECLQFKPDTMILGTAPRGGGLPSEWVADIKEAIEYGLNVYSGLHVFLNDIAELTTLAKQKGVKLWDVRDVPTQLPVGLGRAKEINAKVVLTVGSDCAIGKMSVCLELLKVARAKKISAKFIPTGQTGILIANDGMAVDRVISDFVAGACEKLLFDNYKGEALILVEGQGSIFHPGYSGVSLGLLHGVLPTHMIFCHQPTRKTIKDTLYPFPDFKTMIRLHEELTPTWRKGKVIGIALNTDGLSETESRQVCEDYTKNFQYPCTDCVRFGAEPLLNAIMKD